MIAKSSKELNEHRNPKTKKQLQILMSRNSTESNCNSSVENKEENYCTETKIQELQVNVDVNDDNCNRSCEKLKLNVHETTDDTTYRNKQLYTNAKTTDGSKSIREFENKEGPEVKFLEKSRFEEIENKLEEMFAGIEDEQVINSTEKHAYVFPDKDIIAIDNSNAVNSMEMSKDNCFNYNLFTCNNSSLSTKAAKKSTGSFSHTEKKTSPSAETADVVSMPFLNTIPPRRRLSMGINTGMLEFSIKPNDDFKQNTKKSVNDLPKKKVKNNNRRSCSEYKKKMSCFKPNNKKKVTKIEAPCKSKQKQQKIKPPRIQRLLSSDNDNDLEERTQQTREVDNKLRSPFIQVKNDGSIIVVNTISADDLNEKYTRSKKTTNYVCEKKNVKGCHSSTLSNRYDADTADSSWICVLCKRGPHKKGLGDLFGPYLISTDCDEYRFAIDFVEKFNKRRRTDASFFTTISTDDVFSSNKMTKRLNETTIKSQITDIHHFSGCNEGILINNFSLGMSKISEDSFEIWIHEDCAIWAPNILVIGSRLVGLEDATWNSTRYECVYCLKPGALLCCLQRDCKTTAHVPCARECNWLLNELTFWAHCKKHVSNKT